MKFLLLMLSLWANASDANIHRVDDGLYTEGRTGVAYLPVALETGWYVEALDRSGAMVLDRRIVGAELTEKDAVTIAARRPAECRSRCSRCSSPRAARSRWRAPRVRSRSLSRGRAGSPGRS